MKQFGGKCCSLLRDHPYSKALYCNSSKRNHLRCYERGIFIISSKSFSSSSTIFMDNNSVYLEKQRALEYHLYKNKSFDCLIALFNGRFLDFSNSVFAVKDVEFMKKLLDTKPNGVGINDLPEEMKDKEMIMKLESLHFKNVPEKLKKDKDIILKVLEMKYSLEDLSEIVQNIKDDETLVKAIEIQGALIKYASEKLKNKKSLVLKAVTSSPQALEFISEKLRGDKSIVLKAVKGDGSVLQFASQELRCDPEVVMAAVKSNPYSLIHASEELRNDAKIAMTAIKTGEKIGLIPQEMGNPPIYILRSVGDKLKREASFMIKALSIEKGYVYSCDCEEVLKRPEVILSLKFPYVPSIDLNSFLSTDKDFTRKLFKKHLSFSFDKKLVNVLLEHFEPDVGISLLYRDKAAFIKAAMEKIENRELALKSVELLHQIPGNYLSDREFILDALKSIPYLFKFAPKELSQDVNFLRDALNWPCVPFEISYKIPRLLALEKVCQDGLFLRNLNPDLRQDREIVYKAILNNPRAIRYAGESLQKDKKLIHMIIDKGLLFVDLHPDIKYDFDIMERVFEINKLPCKLE